MTVHYSLARPRRAIITPRIARDGSRGERLVGARLRSLAGPRLLLGRSMRSATGHFCRRRTHVAPSGFPSIGDLPTAEPPHMDSFGLARPVSDNVLYHIAFRGKPVDHRNRNQAG